MVLPSFHPAAVALCLSYVLFLDSIEIGRQMGEIVSVVELKQSETTQLNFVGRGKISYPST